MKSLFKMAVVCSCFLMGLSVAYAAGGKGNGNGCRSICKPGKNLNSVDNKGDGIRDYTRCRAYSGRGKGRGVRDGSGPINTTKNAGPNFVDLNEDGICDNISVKSSGN